MRVQAGLTFLTVATMLFALVTPATHGEDREITIVPETETVKRIRAALDGPISDEFKPEERKGPLHKIIKRISELHQIPIEFDSKSLGDAGVQTNIPVVFSSARIPLKSALRIMLHSHELTTLIKDEILVVTTKAAADDVAQNGIVRIYDVDGLCPPQRLQNRFQQHGPEVQCDAIVSLIQDTWWHNCRETGSVHVAPINGAPMLIVSSRQETEDDIAVFLRNLRMSHACQVKPDPRYANESGGIPVSFGRAAELSWLNRFSEVHDIKAIERIELQELPKLFSTLFSLPLELDLRALGDAGVSPDVTLNFIGGKFSLKTTLAAMLRGHELTWLVRNNVIWITTRASADDIAVNGEVRVYPVADLVGHVWSPANSNQATDYDSLIQLIHGTIAPTTWSGGSGPASDIQSFNGSLVICQTWSVHEEIGLLLTALRKAKLARKPVVQPPAPQGLQVRVFTIPVTSEPPVAAPSPATMTQATQVAKELVETIPQIIATKAWKGAGGEGTIHFVGNQLIVRQDATVIDEIAELLVALGYRGNFRSLGGFGAF